MYDYPSDLALDNPVYRQKFMNNNWKEQKLGSVLGLYYLARYCIY